jgi:hypothetical protein
MDPEACMTQGSDLMASVSSIREMRKGVEALLDIKNLYSSMAPNYCTVVFRSE